MNFDAIRFEEVGLFEVLQGCQPQPCKYRRRVAAAFSVETCSFSQLAADGDLRK
jgi:hypothetical protein